MVCDELEEQLTGHADGYYESGLPWKGGHLTLPTNKSGGLRRLQQLLKELERTDTYDQYETIIREQLEENIVEPAPPTVKGREYYIPHKAVIRGNAETTKVRIVYDASAREGPNYSSLNDCLNPGPPLQKQLWNVLVRSRFYPILPTGDLQKAFCKCASKKKREMP